MKTDLPPKILERVDVVAHMLSLSKSEVYAMLNRGELQGTPSRPRRVLLASVQAWVDKNVSNKA